MKLLQNSEDAKATRKSLKPQVERRRRERMNHSLESLKTLLLQRQEATQRRIEKAEILEHTVLFLQKSGKGDQTRAEEDGGGGRKHSFQDGVSTCLQRAAQFLGPHGKSLLLGAALESSFADRLSRPDSDSAACVLRNTQDHSSTSSQLLGKSSRSILRSLIDRSGYRICTSVHRGASCVKTCEQSLRSPSTHQQPHKVSSPLSTQSLPQSLPVGQTLWRPWP
ncbi:transcription factor HES-2 [Labrus bergylta]|uniref:Transcription factor HES-2-like n=1 Tax=Labrus bergylta TaxID=56723 RepID=A0A3Q3E7F7_9LABR|nr:transcription factor HES-2-like [Labrus bergylta]XP_060905340.1 transcription factor HES-2-like [Labrus mixtus]